MISIINIIKLIIRHLVNIINTPIHAKKASKENVDKNESKEYVSLSPRDNIDEDGSYQKSLLWALNNKQEQGIQNIAVTGPYGSGKSSVLKTFQKNHQNNGFKFLNISLANFVGKKENSESKGEERDKLEISILQQIFYHEKSCNIPDSRFKRVVCSREARSFRYTIYVIIFFFSGFYTFFPLEAIKQLSFFAKTKSINIPPTAHYLSIGTFLLFGFIVLYRTLPLLKNFKVKVKLKDVELESKENQTHSILNQYLDEILYFFEKTKYNVVIIEDLDRFESIDVFSKLREINYLINNSKNISDTVVFIYAIRDDILVGKDRTKFFDYIIPIIPIVDTNNSRDILIRRLKGSAVSEDVINILSLYIDDMRLLNNIVNEYYVSRQKMDKELDQDKLFALITYKNLFPEDFVHLLYRENEGILYSIFESKSAYIKKIETKYSKDIDALKNDIKILEQSQIDNIRDLRRIYLFQLSYEYDTREFIVNGHYKTVTEFLNDNLFQVLKSNQVKAESNGSFIDFKELENKICSEISYDEKSRAINSACYKGVGEIKEQVGIIKEKLNKCNFFNIKNIFEEESFEMFFYDHWINKNRKPYFEEVFSFIRALVFNSLIEEDYFLYTSVFHEESISYRDQQFLISIYKNQFPGEDYKLDKVENLVNRIGHEKFNTDLINNYHIIDELLSNKKVYQKKRDIFFQRVFFEFDFQFVENYLSFGVKLSEFVLELCKYHSDDIWEYIEDTEYKLKHSKKDWLKWILNYADLEDVIGVGSCNREFVGYLVKQADFFDLFENNDRAIDILDNLGPRFFDLNFDSVEEKTINYIYTYSHYCLTFEMLEKAAIFECQDKSKGFYHQNYSFFKETKCFCIIRNIDKYFNEYIELTYTRLDPQEEKEEYLVMMLNNSNASLNNLMIVIDKNTTRISSLEEVQDSELHHYLIANNKIEVTWKNLTFYHQYVDTKYNELIDYLNKQDTFDELSRQELPEEGLDDLIATFLYAKEMDDLIYKGYMSLFKDRKIDGSRYIDIPFSKLMILSEIGLFRITYSQYNDLQEKRDDINVSILRYAESFIDNISYWNLKTKDLKDLIECDWLDTEIKTTLIDYYGEELINKFFFESVQVQYFVINNDAIEDNLFTNTLQFIPRPISLDQAKINYLDLSFNKIDALIKGGIFKLSADSYLNIRNKFGKDAVDLLPINKDWLSDIGNWSFNLYDIDSILLNPLFTDNDRVKVLTQCSSQDEIEYFTDSNTINYIVNNNKLDDRSYFVLLDYIAPHNKDSITLDISNLNKEKFFALVEHGIFEITPYNYLQLKESRSFIDINILRFNNHWLDDIEIWSFNEDDLNTIVKSDFYNHLDIMKVINDKLPHLDIDKFDIKSLVNYINGNIELSFGWGQDIIKIALNDERLTVKERIELFITWPIKTILGYRSISFFLHRLGSPYSQLIKRMGRPKIEYSSIGVDLELFINFLSVLKDFGYLSKIEFNEYDIKVIRRNNG